MSVLCKCLYGETVENYANSETAHISALRKFGELRKCQHCAERFKWDNEHLIILKNKRNVWRHFATRRQNNNYFLYIDKTCYALQAV